MLYFLYLLVTIYVEFIAATDKVQQTPAPPLQCGFNEVAVKCRTICPPQNCEIAYTEYNCNGSNNICESGCDCKPNYLRNSSGICILNDDCPAQTSSSPTCGVNEIARDCRKICPPQTCQSRLALYKCRSDIPCEAGCDCVANYLRNDDGICIPAEKCDTGNKCSDPNASPQDCPRSCQPTCARPNTTGLICTDNCLPSGCVCNSGYILNETGGKCIKQEACPSNCGNKCSDPNASPQDCPRSCQPTCARPNTTGLICTQECLPSGCVCNPGYILNETGGKCIKKEACPSNCGNKCSDPNASPQECPRSCQPTCAQPNTTGLICTANCLPSGCVCNPGFILNETGGKCIKKEACPSNCDKKCPIPDKCIRTCASPNPSDCSYSPPKTNIDGCQCKEGYILSKKGGKCIKIQDCPVGCNGDVHARAKQNPLACPSTCHSPDATLCEKASKSLGCACEPGYLLSSKRGKCVLPEKCPGGNPCPENAEFRYCKYNCPENYCPVDDNSDKIVCDPSPICLSGCACKLNHRRLSYDDNRCIVASDCPPVDCTRLNEVWNGCPSPCFSGNCEDRAFQNATCNTLVLNCQPKCVCRQDTFRNSEAICVPACECDN